MPVRHPMPPALRVLLCCLLIAWTVASGAGTHRIAQAGHAGAASAALGWRYRSFTLSSPSTTAFYRSGPALAHMAKLGANAVTLVVTWYAATKSASDLAATGGTASDASLISAIQQAHRLGLAVIVKPQVDLLTGEWRAYLKPSDPARWFARYSAVIEHYARIAAQQHAAVLCIGAELIALSTDPAMEPYWRVLIAGVRQRFKGPITYSANWGWNAAVAEYSRIRFWDALDYLGISAYYPVAAGDDTTLREIVASWTAWRTIDIAPFQARWRKPVLFTEVGYRNLAGATHTPYAYQNDGQPDPAIQALGYQGFFVAWHAVGWVAGALFWSWNIDSVGTRDTGFDVQGKPAAGVVDAWFHGRGRPSSVAIPARSQPLQLLSPLAISGARVPRGGTLTAWATVCNGGSAPLILWHTVLAVRPAAASAPGFGGDLSDTWNLTLAPGACGRIEQGRTIGPREPLGGWSSYITYQTIDGAWHSLAGAVHFSVVAAGPSGSGGLSTIIPLALASARTARGSWQTATVTLQNRGATAVTLQHLIVAARPAGASAHATRGNLGDLGDTRNVTLQPGQRYTLQQSSRIGADAAPGRWEAILRYQTADGVWHVPGAQAFFRVTT